MRDEERKEMKSNKDGGRVATGLHGPKSTYRRSVGKNLQSESSKDHPNQGDCQRNVRAYDFCIQYIRVSDGSKILLLESLLPT